MIEPGAGQFVYEDERGNPPRPVTVWTYRPEGRVVDLPIVFVMHGANRDGDKYRDAWAEHATRSGLLVLAPEFSQTHYPGYPLGCVRSKAGDGIDEQLWTFSVIEHLFDEVKRKIGHTGRTYAIYGHSAGAQFVHRFLFFEPDARVRAAVAANAGAYLMPSFEIPYPHGFANSELGGNTMCRAFGKRLTVLLGTADSDPNHQDLPRSPEMMEQGRHRFERGHAFFQVAKRAAKRLNTPLNWTLQTVAGVGHDNAGMIPAAVILLEQEADFE